MPGNSSKIHEIDKILTTVKPGPELNKKKYLLRDLIPELRDVFGLKPKNKAHFKDIWSHTLRVVNQSKQDRIIRWAAFFHDLGKARAFKEVDGKVTFHSHEAISAAIFNRFAKKHKFFSNEDADKIYFLIKNLGYIESYDETWSDSAVRRFSRETDDLFYDLVELSKADITTASVDKKNKILLKLENLVERVEKIRIEDAKESPLPKGLGLEIIKTFDIKAGREIGLIKENLIKAIDDGKILAGQDFNYYIDFIKGNK